MSPLLRYQVVSIDEVPEEKVVAATPEDQPVVLIVDDEPLVADTLRAILSRAGYAAVAAYDGASALQLCGSLKPELLITDVAMPRMNGVELALAMVALRPTCKVLLFSGHATSADLVYAQNAGHNFPLLSKPVHPTEMLRQVAQRLATPEPCSQILRPSRDLFPMRGFLNFA